MEMSIFNKSHPKLLLYDVGCLPLFMKILEIPKKAQSSTNKTTLNNKKKQNNTFPKLQHTPKKKY